MEGDATRTSPDLDAVHAAPVEALQRALESGPDGLSAAEAEARLATWGPNDLPAPEPRTWVSVFAEQFRSPLIYVLVLAAGLSALLREWSDAGFIALVLVINALLGTFQEYRAERSAAALRTMVPATTLVLRDGDVSEVDAVELVPGDVVLLESGDKVPADCRLLGEHELSVDESALTGESLPVTKDAGASVDPAAGLAERPTMVHAGTLVTVGRARGLVVSTGAMTALGGLAEGLRERPEAEPPLITRLRRFTLTVGVVVAVAACLVVAIELLRGSAWEEVVLIAVAMAVSAIPEGLPVALTVALAVAVRRMSRRNAIVRRMVAIESLGSCSTVATDKTGTLTVNELTVRHVVVPGERPWSVTGVGVDPTGVVLVPDAGDEGLRAVEQLARAGVLCNEATLAAADGVWHPRGDAVDVALLVLGHKVGITRPLALDAAPLLDEIPFEPHRKYAASLHAAARGEALVVMKGAAEEVLPRCATMLTLDGERTLDRAAVEPQLDALAGAGERVLAVARRRVLRDPGDELDHDELLGLTLLGLVAMTDPLRPESASVVRRCARAGVEVVMLTGDHPVTAFAIARELGLARTPDQVVTGAQLAQAGDEETDELVRRAEVFARVEPDQKRAIVATMMRQGKVVAVTGDGANDAPALHHAHVGVAMGRKGTDVAREAAEIVITDDRLASLVAGVEEGRVAYGNVRKVVQLLVSTGAGELLLVITALVIGLPLPLLAVQLLWLNLVTNGIQDVALGFEPAEGDEMDRPPRRPGEPVFDRLMVERVLLVAVAIAALTLPTFHWMLSMGASVEEARNTVVLLMVLMENVLALSCRSELLSVFSLSPRRNLLLVLGTVVAQLVHVGAMHLPLAQQVLGLQRVSLERWLTMVALAAVLLLVVELHKAAWRRRRSRNGTSTGPAAVPSPA
ncbi:cation-translocating P-type ATPase [Nocardioides sp. GCM10027113]|uniref:cation-translocating P-type ATPase n=1 Tax=unclassified Nocardioides TaxID=2615069 RepID=UPI003606F4E5